jgi:hypothetical protein
LKEKQLLASTSLRRVRISSIRGREKEERETRASRQASTPSSWGILLYISTTSMATRVWVSLL